MKKIVIGVVNSAIGTSNMGCSALTWSFIHLLERICQDRCISAVYYLFDIGCTSKQKDDMCDALALQRDKVKVFSMPSVDKRSVIGRMRSIKHTIDNHRIFDAMRSCAALIDMTQGDSFSDIYGAERFYRWTDIKKCIEDRGYPLILGPQTYGPFSDDRVREYAVKVIDRAKAVISRDQISADYLRQYTDKSITVGTDLAFELPYLRKEIEPNGFVKVGINPSGLLCKTKTDFSAFTDPLTTDYEAYLTMMINWLQHEGKYEIHMIPHVGNEAIDCFGHLQGVTYHKGFDTPVDAKNLISQMDVFIGARMHAAIAALSSGVPVIPTAYSRKFVGLFRGVGYEHIIDLRKLSTRQSVDRTIDCFRNIKRLKNDVSASQKQLEIKRMVNYSFFEKLIAESAE